MNKMKRKETISRLLPVLLIPVLLFPNGRCGLTEKMKEVYEVRVGDSLSLNCSTDIPTEEIQWFHIPVGKKNREEVYSAGEFYYPYDSRFEMHLNRDTGAFHLFIRRILAADAGTFQCWDNKSYGERSDGQLVVLDSNPDCVSNIRGSTELIGVNDCSVKPDALELSCTTNYHGNRAPGLRWRRVDRPDEVLAQNTTGGSVVLRLNESLHRLLRDSSSSSSSSSSSFICEALNSPSELKKINCSFTIDKVLYAFENRTEIHVKQNDEVWCHGNTNSRSCSYSWHDDRDQQVSIGKNLTTRRLGAHHCKARCQLRNNSCHFVAKRIYVDHGPDPPEDTTLLWLLMILVVVAVVFVTIVVVAIFYTKHKRNMTEQMERLQKLLYSTHSEKIPYKDDPSELFIIRPSSQSVEPPSPALLSSTAATAYPSQQQPKIRGVAVLGESIFVVFASSKQIQVFDTVDYQMQRHFEVPDLVDPWDIASSGIDNCLYVMDDTTTTSAKQIIRFQPNGTVMLEWTTKKDAGYLSVTTSEGNVIMAVFKKKLLKEFTPEGDLVRKIRVSATGGRVIHPHHGVKLSTTGHYAVIHGIGDSLHRVCIVNDQGNTIKTFGGRRGGSDALMNLPKYLVVDGAGSMMVLDQNNNRVILLDCDLKFNKELICRNKGLDNPSRIYLDEARGRLLVAEGACVRVFDVQLKEASVEEPVPAKENMMNIV